MSFVDKYVQAGKAAWNQIIRGFYASFESGISGTGVVRPHLNISIGSILS